MPYSIQALTNTVLISDQDGQNIQEYAKGALRLVVKPFGMVQVYERVGWADSLRIGETPVTEILNVNTGSNFADLAELQAFARANFYGDNVVIGNTTANPVPVRQQTTNPFRAVSTPSINATTVRATPGVLDGLLFVNTASAPRFLRIYDKASNPVPASDVPVMTCVIPHSNGAGAGFSFTPAKSIAFSNGIAFVITAAVGQTDTTPIGENEVVGTILHSV